MAPDNSMDPRESILRHADKHDEFDTFAGDAYKETQPKPLYYHEEEEEDAD